MDATELRANARKCARAIYAVADEAVAADVSAVILALLDELDRAEAKLAGVEKERDEARKWAADWHAVVDAICTILGVGLLDADQVVNSVRSKFEASEAALSETRDRAVKALEPFAGLAEIYDHPAGNRPTTGEIAAWSDHRVGERAITVENLRLARKTRSELLKDGGGNRG